MSTVDNKASFSKETYLGWYELMLRIRKLEERAEMMYGQEKIRGFLHLYIGQEAIAAGLHSALRVSDPIISAYRVHGLALMRGITAKSIMAELYGKSTGNVEGKGGSMHYYSKEFNLFGGNGIVGAQIPQGAGIALAEQYKGTDNVCITMFGDGAARQGALYEAFNMAMTWKLPVIFVCENNGYAMGTSVERTSNITELYKIGAAFDMPSEAVDGMTPETIHEAFSKALEHCRAGKGPYFLELNTYRYKGHSRSDAGKYRTKDEVKSYKDIDPIKVVEKQILDKKMATKEDIKAIKSKVTAEILDAVKFAEASPLPLPEDLYKHNYVEDDYPFLT